MRSSRESARSAVVHFLHVRSVLFRGVDASRKGSLMAMVVDDEHAWLLSLSLATCRGRTACVLPSLHAPWDVTVPPVAVINMQCDEPPDLLALRAAQTLASLDVRERVTAQDITARAVAAGNAVDSLRCAPPVLLGRARYRIDAQTIFFGFHNFISVVIVV